MRSNIMLPHLKKYIAAILFTLACITANAQENQYSIKQYNNKNGLPNNFMTSMAFDKNGFLWIAMEGGAICRFNGQNFRAYNMLNTPAFKTNAMYGIYQLPGGNLEIIGRSKNWYKMSSNYTITADSVLSADRWLTYDTESFFEYGSLINNPNWPKSVENPTVPSTIANFGLLVNGQECYASINEKIYYLNNSGKTVLELKGLEIKDGIYFKNNHFILNGLFVTNNKNGVSAYRKGIAQPQIRYSNDARALMAKVSKGTGQYFCTSSGAFLISNSSLYRLGMDKDSIWTTFLMNNKALDNNNIGTIKQDLVSGNIYISTIQGLFVLRHISIHDMEMEKTPSYNTNIVTDIIPLDNGDILNSTQYFNIYTKNTKLLKTQLLYGSLFKCSDGTLLYKRNDTLIWSDQDMQHTYLRKKTKTFANVIEDKQHGCVWALFDSALWKLQKNGEVEKMVHINKCLQLIQPTANTILLGPPNGWVVYDIAKNKIDSNPIHPILNTATLYKTKDSAVWFGTSGRGFYRYKDGKFTQMPLDIKKKLLSTTNFYEDDKGFLWIGTSNGLVQCLKSDLDSYALDSTKLPYYYLYDEYDGLEKSTFISGVISPYAIDSHGTLVYGTLTGVTYFPPLAMRPLTISNKILIESLSVDDSIIAISDHIALRPNFNRLKVSAVLPYFGNRENIALEYNISGLNNTWYQVDENGVISIDRLPAGTYTLVVRSQKGFGTNSYQYSSFSFTVLPYFYQTWWFYTLILLTVILVTAFFFLSKTRALVKGKVLLEKQVEARTEKLNESLNNLNIVMEDLYKSEQKFFNANEVKEQAMAIISHDLKAPVRYLNIAAKGFRANLGKLSMQEIDQFSKSLEQSTEEINGFVEGLLQWLVLQQEDFKATYSEVYIFGLFKEVASLYKDVAALHGNVIVIDPELDKINITTDRDILKLIIRNLVDNAIKNTKNGQIRLSATQLSGVAMVSVADNGVGMNKEKLEKLLSDNEYIDRALKTNSLGFGFVKRFLKLVKGSITIESELGIGTKVFVSLNF